MTTKTIDKPDLRFAPSPGLYCPKCEKTKAAYEFALNKRSKTGRQGYCRRCMAAYRVLKQEEPVAKKATKKAERKPGGWFKCTSCGTAKHTSEFHKRSGIKSGIQSMCKACKKTYDKNRLEAMKAPKPGAIVEVPVPERIGFFDRMVAFIFGGWLIR